MRGSLLIVIALALSVLRCDPFECADCGPCGIVGTTSRYTLRHQPGVDPSGKFVVQLGAGAPGDCGAPNRFWLDSDGNLTPAPAGTFLSSREVGTLPSDGGPSEIYSRNGTTATIDNHSETEVRVTFDAPPSNTGSVPGKQVVRTCSTMDGVAVTCL